MPRASADTPVDPDLQAALEALEGWSAPRSPMPTCDARWQSVAELTAAVLERPVRPLRDPLLIPLA